MKNPVIRIIFLLTLFIKPHYGKAIDFSTPSDILTLEALIALHQEMKKNEDAALTQVTTITAEQEVTTNLTSKISDIKQTLHTKLSDVNSYVMLASVITNTTMKLSDLVSEYENFIKVCTPIAVKKPYMSVRYANTQRYMAEETARLTKSIVAFSASGINLLKASMDEKFKMIYLIDDSISRMRNRLSAGRNYIIYTSEEGFGLVNVRDIISSEEMEKVSQYLITVWSRNKK